jgi:putative transposase
LTLCYLDECGFSPSQPVTYSWTRCGERKRIPYENPQRRRVNALAALVRDDPSPSLTWDTAPRHLTSHDLLAFLPGIPRRTDVPLVVVLDNGSHHRSDTIRAALPDLWAQRIYLYFLPSYSPELNRIEPVFRVIKHQEMPTRTYPTVPALEAAVDTAFAAYETRHYNAAKARTKPGLPA